MITIELRYSSIVSYQGKMEMVNSIVDNTVSGNLASTEFESNIFDSQPYTFISELQPVVLNKAILEAIGFYKDSPRRKTYFLKGAVHISLADMGKGRYYFKKIRRNVEFLHDLLDIFFVFEQKAMEIDLDKLNTL